MPHFSNQWFQQHIPQWKALFKGRGWDGTLPLTAIEIGSFEGQSTTWMLDNLLTHADSKIYCLDTFQGGVEHSEDQVSTLWDRFCKNIAENPGARKVEVRKNLSRVGLTNLLSAGVKADFIYVDGSHQAADVLEDLVLSFRLLKPQGLLICDDYLWWMEQPQKRDLLNSPKLAIDSFVNCYIRKIAIPNRQQLYQFAFVKLSD